MQNQRNILIVGQGLAGTLMSFELYQRNIDFHVVDNAHKSASTKAAAGLINPITGRRYNKSWMIDDLLPVAIQQYEVLENLLDIEIINKRNILRTLRTPKQINLWNEASTRIGYEDYIEPKPDGSNYTDFVSSDCKYGEVKQSYQINIKLLIEAYQKWLLELNKLEITSFDFNDLKFEGHFIFYKGQKYSEVIFCQGHFSVNNPFFGKAGFQLAKGEALILAINDFKAQKILRDDIFFVPNHKEQFWCGGGYLWKFEDDKPTESWKSDWLDKIDQITNNYYNIVEHIAGIRPCVLDRKPLLGRHQIHENLILFNGLGTKGTSLGPYFAKHLADHLINDSPILKEVDWKRYA